VTGASPTHSYPVAVAGVVPWAGAFDRCNPTFLPSFCASLGATLSTGFLVVIWIGVSLIVRSSGVSA